MFLFDSVFNLGFRKGCFEEFHCYISLTLTTILEKEGEFSQFGTSAASEGRLAMQLKDHHNQQHLLPTPSYQDHLLPPQVLQDYEPFDMVVSFPSLSSTGKVSSICKYWCKYSKTAQKVSC